MAVVGQIDLVSDTTMKKVLEQLEYGNTLRAAQAADSLAVLKSDLKGIQSIVRKGLAPHLFEVGDQIVVPWTDKDATKTYQVPMDVVHFGNVTLKSGEVVPGMFLQWHYATPYGVQFDECEALYVVKDTPLQPGAYTFHISAKWGKAEAGDYTFTLTKSVPVGGQIAGLKYLPDTEQKNWTIQTYENNKTTSPLESVKVTVGNAGTSLGNLEVAGNAKLNSIHRVGYGYNRWSQSALRQYLNSDKAKGQWWNPQHDYDRPPEQLASKSGFLTGFEKTFLDVIGEIKVTTALNTVTDSAAGTDEDTYDKIFLPSLEQIYAKNQLAGKEGEYWEYWKRATGATTPQEWYKAFPERITYGIESQTSAQHVRLRSASRGNGYYTWYVHTSGTVSDNYASSAFRCAPACVIC